MKEFNDKNQFNEFDFDEIGYSEDNDDVSIFDIINNRYDETFSINYNINPNDTFICEGYDELSLDEKSNEKKHSDQYDNSSDVNSNFKDEVNNQSTKPIINNLNDFIKYLNLQINRDKMTKISKDILIYFYSQLQKHLNIEPLNRDEKRNKNKIFIKLFLHSEEIIECVEEKQEEILLPIHLFLCNKLNRKKSYYQYNFFH